MVDIQHKNITGADAAHPPFYASESDPTTTLGAYRGWFKPSTGEAWIRNATNTDWISIVVTGVSAGDVAFTPAGTIAAADVQAAIEEVASEAGSSVSAATEGAAGIAELATQTETDAGADDGRIVTPLKAATRYLAKVGGTLTGFLTLNADPTSPMHAATKQYADALVSGGSSPASETTAGIAELATQAETDTGTDDARIVTPLKLAGRTATETRAGVVELATDAEGQTGTDTARALTPANLSARSATETRTGIAEVATQAETDTGTDDAKIVTPLKLKTNADLHINDTTDAHDASAISYAGGTGMSATDVEAAVDELATEKANDADLTAHIGDTTDAHDASAISFSPAGSIAATNVQSAIEEAASEAGGGGSAHTIRDEGSAMTQRANLNFIGTGVTVTDDAGNAETEVTIPGASAASETTAGVLEIATQGETDTGTDDSRAVTPAKLANYPGLAGYRTLVTLGSDVSNSTTSFADVTGLSFSVSSGTTYRFEVLIVYDAQAATTGNRWSLNGPAFTFLGYRVIFHTSNANITLNNQNSYDVGTATVNSAFTSGNIVEIKGVIRPSASGTLVVRFASEAPGTNNQITVKAGSTLEWW